MLFIWPHRSLTRQRQWLALQRSGDNLPALRLVGDLDGEGTALLSNLKRVSLIAPLPRPELLDLMASARALLLPSEIEGFGIPAVEAYLLGTPVAYVKATAVEEILGIDPPGGFCHDTESFRAALAHVLEIAPKAIEERGFDLRHRYSWEGCINRTVAAYNLIL
jgi:glycosyltransferase involved in cell wall biosynthesis